MASERERERERGGGGEKGERGGREKGDRGKPEKRTDSSAAIDTCNATSTPFPV